MNIFTLEAAISIIVGMGAIAGVWWMVVKPVFRWVQRWFREQLAWRRLKIERLEFQLAWVKKHSEIPMFRLDAHLNCIWANQALCELLDVDSSELLGKVWFNIVQPKDLDAVVLKWTQAVKNKAPYRNTQEMLIDGNYTKTIVTGDPFIYAGKVIEFIGSVRVDE